MTRALILTALLWVSMTRLQAQDQPSTTHFKEDFSNEAVFKKNWELRGPPLPASHDKTKPLWEVANGALHGFAYKGVHPIGYYHKITGTDVRFTLRVKLGTGAGFYAVFSGMGKGSNTIDPQSSIRFRRASIHLNSDGVQIYDERYVPPPADIPYVKGMDLSKGNMSRQKFSLTENEWHDVVMEMVGKQLTLRIDGKEIVGHLTYTGDEPKWAASFSVGNDSNNPSAEAWIADVSIESLAAK